jgi:hypothetical protein
MKALHVRLGKKDHRYDARTLMLADYFMPELRHPVTYDFDKGRSSFPTRLWGNDKWENSVIVAQANQLLRFERIEQRRTLLLQEDDVVWRYKLLSGAEDPGDKYDTGLVVLDNLKDWFHNGWEFQGKKYQIGAYGELLPNDPAQLRMACYLLHGIHLGFSLPVACTKLLNVGLSWDYKGEPGPEWVPGSWGGQLAYAKRYDTSGFEVMAWGRKFHVSDNFIRKYCDEAWAVVDSLDSWQTKQTMNVEKLARSLKQIGGIR